jgi:hypothetical protein
MQYNEYSFDHQIYKYSWAINMKIVDSRQELSTPEVCQTFGSRIELPFQVDTIES